MKKIIQTALVFVSINLYANTNSPLTINVSIENKQTYPYYMGEGDKLNPKNPGLAIDALKSIEKKLNIKFNFKRESSLRGQKKLQYNKTDMLLFASYKKERETLGVYPTKKNGDIDTDKRTMNLSYFLYTLKDSDLNWDGKNFINLKGKIGATKGYSVVKLLKDKGVEVSENNSNLGDPKKLIVKRIQGFANQGSKIDPYLKNNPQIAKKIKKIEIPLKTKPYFILFSYKFYKQNKELSNKIWEELKQLDTLDKFKKFRDKY
jgi:polar amino acid transport system substrate-binding protein